MKRIATIIFLCLITVCAQAKERVPRTIISIYSQKHVIIGSVDRPHRLAEMPLNHLGLTLVPHNIDTGFPDIANNPDVRGVLLWAPEVPMDDPIGFLKWANAAIAAGKKFVIVGYPAFLRNTKNVETPKSLVNEFMHHLGVEFDDEWIDLTYDWNVIFSDPKTMDFERGLKGIKPAFQKTSLANGAQAHLIMEDGNKPGSKSYQVVTSNNGGYISDSYEAFLTPEDEGSVRRWFINPFEFFRLAYNTDDLPKADTTTINGLRIFYSQVDGDGWNNVSLVQKYKEQELLSAEVLYREVLTQYPDIPVTIAPIVADIDASWVGTPKSIAIAKKIFELPHIQVGNHTLSHPFMWSFFADGNADKERPFLNKYPFGNWAQTTPMEKLLGGLQHGKKKHEEVDLQSAYSIPRAFANKKFNIKDEIVYTTDFLNKISPENKKTELLQWSGDTTPFEKALELCDGQSLWNLNGGDTRFDREYPSYAWVAPIGRRVGKFQQIYASNSNENTYTDLWQGRYFGYQYLIRTVKNTEKPKRIKPFNIYYHMYSAEKDASLNALKANLDYARTNNLIYVTAAQYSRMATNFYGTHFDKISPNTWEVSNNKYMNTIRFDNHTDKAVDFEKSKGILGQRHYQGSLYIFLDPLTKPNLIALKPITKFYESPQESRPYLVEGSWMIQNLRFNDQLIGYSVKGFSAGKFIWYVPKNGNFTAQLIQDNKVLEQVKGKASGNFVTFEIKQNIIGPAEIAIKYGEMT